jgi:hypothetical protein
MDPRDLRVRAYLLAGGFAAIVILLAAALIHGVAILVGR